MDGTSGIIDCHVWLGEEHHLLLDVSDLLSRMSEAGVALSIARPIGAELAVRNRDGNDRVLKAGPRVRGLATANPWFGADAVRELERARDLGAVGVYLHPTRQGFMPTDPVARPVLDFAERAGLPLVIHTGTYIQSDVLAVAEVARRHPSISVVCDAAGWTDMWFELPGLLADVKNLMFCASMVWGRAIANTIKAHGPGRILFGSGEPRDHLTAALRRVDRLDLSDSDRQAVLCDNARRVFKLS